MTSNDIKAILGRLATGNWDADTVSIAAQLEIACQLAEIKESRIPRWVGFIPSIMLDANDVSSVESLAGGAAIFMHGSDKEIRTVENYFEVLVKLGIVQEEAK